jgi:hypothetical protein
MESNLNRAATQTPRSPMIYIAIDRFALTPVKRGQARGFWTFGYFRAPLG